MDDGVTIKPRSNPTMNKILEILSSVSLDPILESCSLPFLGRTVDDKPANSGPSAKNKAILYVFSIPTIGGHQRQCMLLQEGFVQPLRHLSVRIQDTKYKHIYVLDSSTDDGDDWVLCAALMEVLVLY